jgi:hypothetical protein
MSSEHTDDSFAVFYAEQAPAVFALALRHGGSSQVAEHCVDAVFGHLSDHWRSVRDPVRFARRAAVLFVRRTGRPVGHRAVRGHRSLPRREVSSVPSRTPM